MCDVTRILVCTVTRLCVCNVADVADSCSCCYLWLHLMRFVAACCSVLQCVVVWCSVVQCGAVWCSVDMYDNIFDVA